MGSIRERKEIRTHEDTEGNITKDVLEITSKIEPSSEPDYIKLYTRMWCEFNEIPTRWRELFLHLVTRMSYACSISDTGGQIVYTGTPVRDEIMSVLGWQKNMYQKGLQGLCNCNAIRRISRGVYQINPSYAGKGEWKYNPRLERGGIEDIIATFKFKAGSVNTQIIWADDGMNTNLNQQYRDGLGVEKGETATLIRTYIAVEQEPEIKGSEAI